MHLAMKFPFYRINAFVDEDSPNPLRAGNPAAIVLLTEDQSRSLSDSQRQSLATELNLSETSFVTSTSTKNTFNLRWFTPTCEVSLCGHATLAAAVAVRAAHLWLCDENNDTVFFNTMSGTLRVSSSSTNNGLLSMEFPALKEREEVSDDFKRHLLQGLGIGETSNIKQVFQSKFDIVVEMESQKDVQDIMPDFNCLKKCPLKRGVIACSRVGSDGSSTLKDVVFVSRFFAPGLGIDEDPVTGSAHCVLVPMYLDNEESGISRQLSERGGKLNVRSQSDDVVVIAGHSFIVVEGSVMM